jgi:hypothetical protein
VVVVMVVMVMVVVEVMVVMVVVMHVMRDGRGLHRFGGVGRQSGEADDERRGGQQFLEHR